MEPLLRGPEVPLGHVKPVLVLPQARVDEREPMLGVRPLVLGELQILADRVDLRHHGALVGLRGPDLRSRAGARHGGSDSRRECDETERAKE